MVAAATPNPVLHLGELLRAETAKLREFIELLKREQEFLKQGNTDALLTLIDSKNVLAGQLATLAQERENDLSRLSLPAGRAGMEAWAQRIGKDEARQAWQTLLTLATEARELNVLNGKLIGLHMNHNQQAFAALMGASDRAMTYGPDGQQQTSLGGRILGSA